MNRIKTYVWILIFLNSKLLLGNMDTNFIGNKSDSLSSTKPLGAVLEEGKTIFRLFAPNAVKVFLCTFQEPSSAGYKNFLMTRDDNGVWETTLEGEQTGLYYGYKVFHKNDKINLDYKPLCVDPYAKAVTSYTSYLNPRKSIVYKDDYNWEDDKPLQKDWRDLIIYEMHIRDMTAHPSAEANASGTYKGLIEKNIKGGINYIKELGVNAVEFLPTMEFGVVEIPYKDSLVGKFNIWNPYERNHWGYMTSNFFAPESYYSENWKELKWNAWMGAKGEQVKQFKDVVKAFHKEGISVIMDVVYNHLSEYEIGNLKEIDKEYYFRLDSNGNFIAESYCGNDLKTEAPMLRRLIVESVLYWMKEYHIDGFRFDLGNLIDKETLKEVITEARKVNPNVVFVAEPWGGGYDPKGFSDIGWGSWNDQIRNGVKGENPDNGQGWIFGKWYGNNSLERIKSYVNGTLRRDSMGLFLKKEHSVNYLESHDGYTLGDFIRLATNPSLHQEEILDLEKNVKLTPHQLKLNKLAAAFLLTSQGIIMMHSGEEFARSKVIPIYEDVDDKEKGKIDHNSYNKDNETNYINYNHAEINRELVEYYKGLIELRKTYDAFRKAKYSDIRFYEIKENPFALGFSLNYFEQRFFVIFNANQTEKALFELPSGEWEVIVDSKFSGIKDLNKVSDYVELEPVTATVLKMKN